ncbi:MAG: hypothetical protein R3C59_09655 [Planctomycetaceae bacterium]
MSRFPDPERAVRWRQRLSRFECSELTVAEFCRLEGFSTASFYLWRRKLRDTELSDGPAFVPVPLDANQLSGSDRVSGNDRQGLQIELPGGAVINVPSGMNNSATRELIAAVVQATAAEATS